MGGWSVDNLTLALFFEASRRPGFGWASGWFRMNAGIFLFIVIENAWRLLIVKKFR